MLLRILPGLAALALAACNSTPHSTPADDGPRIEATDPEPREAAAPDVERAEIKTLTYSTEIAAPVERVWERIFSAEGYPVWTAPFGPGNYIQGTMAEGERVRILAPGGSGMLAEIAELREREHLSFRHIGYVLGGVEDTQSDSVRSWAPAYETYRFESTAAGTRVTVEQDVQASYEQFMNDRWPRALRALQSLCEAE